MKSIIVTFQDRKGSFCYDLDVPVDVTGDTLTNQVFEVLNQKQAEPSFDARYHSLYLMKQKRVLAGNEDLETAGVLNGDYITIISKI